MRKALIYSILVIFLFNSLGYYFLFELNKYIDREEMQSMIHAHSVKCIVLTIVDAGNDKDFCRVDNLEFSYHGILYDIVHETKSGLTSVFTCLQDNKESELIEGFKRINQHKLLFAIWDHLAMIFISASSIDLNPSFSGTLTFSRIYVALKSLPLPTLSPPPKIA